MKHEDMKHEERPLHVSCLHVSRISAQSRANQPPGPRLPASVAPPPATPPGPPAPATLPLTLAAACAWACCCLSFWYSGLLASARLDRRSIAPFGSITSTTGSLTSFETSTIV